jgi:hypothetical protein
MESTPKSLRIKYGDTAKIERIEPWITGWDVWLDCFKVPILFATKPNWEVGDHVKVTFERIDD